jgi:hypothetical protein
VVRVIDFFSVTKSLALIIIIISGFVWLGQGRYHHSAVKLCFLMLSGLWRKQGIFLILFF